MENNPPSTGEGDGGPGDRQQLTPGLANALVSAALRSARKLALRPVGAVVLDAGGHVIAFQREDLGAALRLQIAVGKATGALSLGMSSRAVCAVADAFPGLLSRIESFTTTAVVAAPGALLVNDGCGGVMCAIAVTGDSGDNDEACARDAIASVGLTPLD